MEKNTASFSRRLNGPPSKRKLASESSSANVEDHELLEKNPSQLSCELDLKNPTFEELTLGMQKLQRQLTQVLSRMDGFEHRLRHIEARNEDVSRHIHNSKPYSHEIKPIDPNIDQLTKDFEERFDLVESNSQALIERVDSCQQNFFENNCKN